MRKTMKFNDGRHAIVVHLETRENDKLLTAFTQMHSSLRIQIWPLVSDSSSDLVAFVNR